MVITILTLFPEMFSGPFQSSIIKRAIGRNIINIEIIDIRKFGIGKHKSVDDTPYGGGTGMIMRADVIVNALESLPKKKNRKVILLSASGTRFTQKTAFRFSKLEDMVLICGHYEGIDARIQEYIDEETSIGDYVLTGGEIPAMVVVDAVVRLVKGVLKEDATKLESFTENLLEHAQYTKPQTFRGKEVPKILLSGNHKKILEWKEKDSLKKTKKSRPDLLKRVS